MRQNYPFIDIAVLDGVRERLSVGDALCVLTPTLDEIVWANASGARMMGFASRDDGIGAEPEIGAAARRQMLSTAPGRKLAVRLANGVSSRLVIIETAEIVLPDGERALLLAESLGEARPESIIEGLDGDGSHAGVIGPGGEIIVASPGLAALNIDNDDLARLAREVAAESDRMVKRRIKTATGLLPAGAGRIGDDPAQCLLLVVETGIGDVTAPAATLPEPASMPAAAVPEPPASVKEAPRWYFSDEGDQTLSLAHTQAASKDERQPAPPALEVSEPAARHADLTEVPAANDVAETPLPDLDSQAASVPEYGHHVLVAADDTDDIDLTAVAIVLGELEQDSAPYLEHDELPVRFAWRIDAAGKFCEVSPELAKAVGPNAADIAGRTFEDVARAFAMDPSGEIGELLERRDTWSGRTVHWPLEGTDMRVPVELAALPVYGRDREFDGFRGFGVIRTADARPDPEAIGLSFGRRLEDIAETESRPDAPLPDDPWKGEKPALKIVRPPAQVKETSDGKIIVLEERRAGRSDNTADASSPHTTLSPAERSAFREIAERLRSDDGKTEATADDEPTGDDVAVNADLTTLSGDGDAPAEEAAIALDSEQAASQETLGETLSDFGSDDDQSIAAAKYEQMLRDLIETVDKPIVADESPVGESPVPPAAVYAEMFRDILETAEETPLDQRMIPVRPAEEILRDAEEHHRQALDEEELLEDAQLNSAHRDVYDQPAEPALEEVEQDDRADGFETSIAETGGIEAEALAAKPFERPAPDTSILMRLPAPVMIYAGKRVYFANPAFLEATGYSSAAELEVLGGIDQLIAGDADAESIDRIGIRIRGNGIRSFSAVIRSVPWNETQAMMLTIRDSDASNNVRAIPLSDKEHADLQGLRQHSAELSSILDTATDGVVILESGGAIRSLNHSAEALFGFGSVEVAGKPFSLLLATESQRSVSDYIEGLSGNGMASIMNDGREVIGREAHGRFIPLFLTIGHLPDSDGYCAVLRDMTQWKRAEEELIEARRSAEQASATKSEFLTRVSHEIRTPLNAIIGFSELMAEERFGPIGSPRYLDYAKDINRSGRHVLDLVNDLLDISKIEAGEQEMNFEAVALNDALSEAVALMQPQANRERVIIRSSFASSLPQVVADLRSVKQIALNLLSNAVRYTGAGGQVIISTAHELTGDVVIRVRDTGIGMSQQDLDQAMKPFKQLNMVKRGQGDGTGLGLPLTKAMVEGNRAKFVITSTPGKGTMVEITFPSVRVLAS